MLIILNLVNQIDWEDVKERRREEANFLVILALDIEFSWLWPNICNPGIRMLWSDAKGSERGGRRKEAGSAGIENRSCARIIPVAVVGVNTVRGQMTTDQKYSIERRVVKEVPAAGF